MSRPLPRLSIGNGVKRVRWTVSEDHTDDRMVVKRRCLAYTKAHGTAPSHASGPALGPRATAGASPFSRSRKVTEQQLSGTFGNGKPRDKKRCPYPECNEVFRDLKAHVLTHITGRRLTCPVTTCDYRVKGFARKYDRDRHVFSHYKGKMVCGFCPGASPAETKSFTRIDIFKRHLTAVHGVGGAALLSPRSSYSSGAAPAGAGKQPSPGYAPHATGKCSACSKTFRGVQEFYEHLDGCVLDILQRENHWDGRCLSPSYDDSGNREPKVKAQNTDRQTSLVDGYHSPAESQAREQT